LINKLNVRQRRVWLVIDASENAVASSEFLPFVSEDIDMEFLEQFMKLSKTTHDLESLSSGTSNSQKRVTPTDVLKYKIDVPEERDEQEKIGVILQRIDEAHVLYQSQITKLKQLKRSLLQKLFM